MATITLQSTVAQDKYTEYVKEAFDLDTTSTNEVKIPFNLNLERLGEWNIGLIVGPSGSGKSVILNQLGGASEAIFDESKALISNFDNISPSEATNTLCAVGLSSVPTWVRPHKVLSNGERYRAELAWILAHSKEGDTIRVDEYTSVVDRQVAKSMSFALQKYVRSQGKRIILAACHYDIIEWLQPDWIYDLGKGGALERGDCLQRRRPSISLRIYRTESNTWRIFAKHHYMTEEMNEAAYCYCFAWGNKPVAFCSTLPMPGMGLENAWRISRLVVLPDFQGIGIGRHIAEVIGGIYKSIGKKMYIKTVSPRLGEYMERSPLWTPTGYNGKEREKAKNGFYSNMKTRRSYCFRYAGDPILGFEHLTKPINEMRKEKSLEGQLSLF